MTDERNQLDPFAALIGADGAPSPNPRFVRRLRGELMQEAARMHATNRPLNSWLQIAPAPAFRPAQRFDRRLLLQLAAVAVLLVAWVGTLAGGGPERIFNAALQNDQDETLASMHRGNSARTGVVDTAGPAADPAVAWRVTPAEPGFVVTNANESTILLAYEASGHIAALEAGSGAERWRFDTGCSFLDTTPLLSGGMVYVSTSCFDPASGALIAIGENDGAERWRTEFASEVQTSPTIDDGRIYLLLSGVPQLVVAIDANDGHEIWRSEIASRLDRLTITPPSATAYIGKINTFSPAIGGGLLYVTAFDGVVSAIDTESGTEAWSYATPGNTLSTPAYDGGTLYFTYAGVTVADVDGGLVALDAETGELRWEAPLPKHAPYSGPVVLDELVVMSIANAPVQPSTNAYDRATGERIWSIDLAGGLISAADTLYMLEGTSGEALAIEPANGEVRWRAFIASYEHGPTEASQIAPDPVMASGRLYVASLAETLLAIESRAGETNTIPAVGSPTAVDFTSIPACSPPAPVAYQTIEGEPALSLVPVNQNQRDGLPAALHPDDLPATTPVDAETEAALRATLDHLLACAQRAGQLDLTGLFSDDFYRRIWVRAHLLYNGANHPYGVISLPWLVGQSAVALAYLTLPDGRVAIEYRVSADYAQLIVFVEEDGQWLIDELVGISPHPEARG